MDPYINCGNENLRCATDGGVVFSSTKCPPPNPNPMSGRLEQTCELPFGYCYTPMINLPQQLSTSISPTNLPAGVMCKKCMTYLNLYCDTSDIFLDAGNENCMMRWTCVLCKSENIISVENSSKDLEEQGTEKLLDAIISQRVVEILQPLTRPPFKSNATTTTVDLSEQSTKTIILVVDGNLSSSEAHAVGHALQSVLDQKQRGNSISWQIGLIVFGKSISIYKLGVVNSGIVVADVVRSHEGFTMLTDVDSGSNIFCHSYLGTSVEALVSCLTAQFSPDENSSKDNDFTSNADVGSSNENGPKKTRLQILKERKHFRLQRQEIDSEPSRSSGTIDCHDSPWTQARERIAQSKPPYRCTGDAVLCALDLASLVASSFRSLDTTKSVFHESRILLFTNGCPNLGEGSVVDIKNDATGGLAAYSTVDSAQMARACSFYNVIGKSAVDVGVGIDIFCTGSSELGFPAYLSLVEASSGYVISHDTFASTRLQFNLGYILQHTHMSRSYKSDSSNLPDTSQPIGDACIKGCLVDLRMSSYLTSTHLIGPGDLVDCPTGPLQNERVAFSEGLNLAEKNQIMVDKNSPSINVVQESLTRIRIGRYDPLSTFSVMLRLNDLYQGDEYAFFQYIVRFIDVSRQSLVTRISSHRLSVANDVGEFLEAIDEEVVPVLLAKEAVYRAMFGRDADIDHPFHSAYIDEVDSFAYDAQQDLDNTVFRISAAFRLLSLVQGTKSIDLTEEGGIKAAGSSMDFAFPPELSDALRRLYHLRRGPLLSPGPVQSADDRVEMRSLFVRFPLEDCLNMMAPTIWSSGSPLELERNTPFLQNVPPETLALWEDRIIAADHWNNMFIWSGSERIRRDFDFIREKLKIFLVARSKYRFPQPNMYMLSETDSMSRRFTSLLAPSHGDPVEHQLTHFHALTHLSQDELKKLHFRFRFYDSDSDPSFRKWFWKVASAANALGSEGTSLCD